MSGLVVLSLSLLTAYPHIFTTQWESKFIRPVLVHGTGISFFSGDAYDAVHIIDREHVHDTNRNFVHVNDLLLTVNISEYGITIYSRKNYTMLVSKQYGFVAVAHADHVADMFNLYEGLVSIPLTETIHFDAYILADWGKISDVVRNSDNWWVSVCAGMESIIESTLTRAPTDDIMTPNQSIGGAFLTEYMSANWGSTSSLRYWSSVCGWFGQDPDITPTPDKDDSGSTHARVELYVAQLWHISEELLARACSPFTPQGTAQPSSPCVLQGVQVLTWPHLSGFGWGEGVCGRGEGRCMNNYSSPCLEDLLLDLVPRGEEGEVAAGGEWTRLLCCMDTCHPPSHSLMCLCFVSLTCRNSDITFMSTIGIPYLLPDSPGPRREADTPQTRDTEQLQQLLFVLLTYQHLRVSRPNPSQSHVRLVVRSVLRGVVQRVEALAAPSDSLPSQVASFRCNLEHDLLWRYAYQDMLLLRDQLVALLSSVTEMKWEQTVVLVGRTLLRSCFGPSEVRGREGMHGKRDALVRELLVGIQSHMTGSIGEACVTNRNNHYQCGYCAEDDSSSRRYVCGSMRARRSFLSLLRSISIHDGADEGEGEGKALKSPRLRGLLLEVDRIKHLLDVSPAPSPPSSTGSTCPMEVSPFRLSKEQHRPHTGHGEASRSCRGVLMPGTTARTHHVISVLPADVEAAERFVEAYQRDYVHDEITRYYFHIIETPPSSSRGIWTHANAIGSSSSPSISTGLPRPPLPSLRSSLLAAEQILGQFATNRDMVSVIIGIEALRALLPPREHMHETAETDAPTVSESPVICYTANVIFAMGTTGGPCNSSTHIQALTEEEGSAQDVAVDLRAFRGAAYEVWNMMEDVWAHPWQRFSDDSLTISLMAFISSGRHSASASCPAGRAPSAGSKDTLERNDTSAEGWCSFDGGVVEIDTERDLFDMQLSSSDPSPGESKYVDKGFLAFDDTNRFMEVYFDDSLSSHDKIMVSKDLSEQTAQLLTVREEYSHVHCNILLCYPF